MSSLPTSFEPFLDIKRFLSYGCIDIQCRDMPDADDIAAGFALYSYLVAAGKKVRFFFSGPHPVSRPCLKSLIQSLHIPLAHQPERQETEGLLVTIGCQPGSEGLTLARSRYTAAIDNHLPLLPLPEICDIRPYLSSVSTLIWLLLREIYTFSPALATGLYYALHTATNAFAEVRFPMDLDMRDALEIDQELFNRLERSNLSLTDLAHTAKALNTLNYHAEDRFVLVNVLPAASPVLSFIGDLALRVDAVDFAVVFAETADAVQTSVRSAVREVKADHLAHWLTAGNLGAGGGTATSAAADLSVLRLGKIYSGSVPEFMLSRVQAYLAAYDSIDCAAAGMRSTEEFRAYQKLPVILGYAPSIQVVAEGTQLHIRMLEGDISVLAREDVYLMIGLAGEVYPVARERFLRLYAPLDAPLEQNFTYDPAVLEEGKVRRTRLLHYARQCRSVEKRVLAKQLERGVKVFTRWDRRSYLCGEPGDWLVRSKEDPADLYVIKKDMFPTLYINVR